MGKTLWRADAMRSMFPCSLREEQLVDVRVRVVGDAGIGAPGGVGLGQERRAGRDDGGLNQNLDRLFRSRADVQDPDRDEAGRLDLAFASAADRLRVRVEEGRSGTGRRGPSSDVVSASVRIAFESSGCGPSSVRNSSPKSRGLRGSALVELAGDGGEAGVPCRCPPDGSSPSGSLLPWPAAARREISISGMPSALESHFAGRGVEPEVVGAGAAVDLERPECRAAWDRGACRESRAGSPECWLLCTGGRRRSGCRSSLRRTRSGCRTTGPRAGGRRAATGFPGPWVRSAKTTTEVEAVFGFEEERLAGLSRPG